MKEQTIAWKVVNAVFGVINIIYMAAVLAAFVFFVVAGILTLAGVI